jgi:LemA protein
MLFVWIILGIVLLAIILLWATYNSLVKLKIKTDEALSDITVQMKRRLDLIPNLVSTVKGYAKHEKETLENVTKARTAAMEVSKDDLSGQAKADNMLTSTLKSLFAVAENYPDLKANENFLQLQSELTDTEDKIQASRRFYNGNVRDFNTKLQVFPTNFIGKMLGFKPREFFDVAEAEKEAVAKAPEVKF